MNERNIYHWRSNDSLDAFPEEVVSDFVSKLNEEQLARWNELDDADRVFHVARQLHLDKCREQAERLGLQEHGTISFIHDPIVLVEMAKGKDAGIELAKRYEEEYGFYSQAAREWGPSFFPHSMWSVAAQHRDGDAVVLFIGDDRGWDDDWEYYVAVAWEPLSVAQDGGSRYGSEVPA